MIQIKKIKDWLLTKNIQFEPISKGLPFGVFTKDYSDVCSEVDIVKRIKDEQKFSLFDIVSFENCEGLWCINYFDDDCIYVHLYRYGK